MKRFEAFQGLRAIAFLLVFFSHCTGYLPIHSGGHGAIGVEIFIVLSGFLMEVHARESHECLLNQCFGSARKKLGKFYWLHMLTMILVLGPIILPWILQMPDIQTVADLCWSVAANVLLIQSWIPDSDYYFSLNAVTWYLSTSMLMYLMFPLFHRWISRCKGNRSKYVAVCLIFAFQLILAQSMQSSVYLHAVIYVHPVSRCLDFIVGMLLGSAYLCRTQESKNHMRWTWAEATSLAMLILVILLFNRVPEAFRYVALSAPAAWMLMSVFAHDAGMISRWLSWRPIEFLGNISFELFMIHRVIISYLEYVQWIARRVLHHDLPGILSTVCTFVLSVAAAWLLHEIGKKLHSRTMRLYK